MRLRDILSVFASRSLLHDSPISTHFPIVLDKPAIVFIKLPDLDSKRNKNMKRQGYYSNVFYSPLVEAASC